MGQCVALKPYPDSAACCPHCRPPRRFIQLGISQVVASGNLTRYDSPGPPAVSQVHQPSRRMSMRFLRTWFRSPPLRLARPLRHRRLQSLGRGIFRPGLESLERRSMLTIPVAPVIIEPDTDGQVVSNFDVHMEIDPAAYFDADGHAHQATTWQIRETPAAAVQSSGRLSTSPTRSPRTTSTWATARSSAPSPARPTCWPTAITSCTPHSPTATARSARRPRDRSTPPPTRPRCPARAPGSSARATLWNWPLPRRRSACR